MSQEQIQDNTVERIDMGTIAHDVLDLARSVALEVADNPEQVGDAVAAFAIEPQVVDFRFSSNMKGYEGWQWSVTLYHDVDREQWTVNESSLIPGEDSLLPPQWIPWKDRLLPSDLSVTDVIGTEQDDARLETGFRKTRSVDEVVHDILDDHQSDPHQLVHGQGVIRLYSQDRTLLQSVQHVSSAEHSGDFKSQHFTDGQEQLHKTQTQELQEELEVVQEMELSRRRVLTPYGRAQAAERWYAGQHGPKSLSTKAADGSVCQTCGFFVPLSGELNLMFGVCANVWSPDDGRVVSRDHGCGQHSDIEPLTPSHLWVQPKPAFDDMHIDIVAQAPRVERESIDALEQAADERSKGMFNTSKTDTTDTDAADEDDMDKTDGVSEELSE